MKKILYIISLLLIGLTALAQETPPTGLKSVNSQLYIHLPDSAIWHFKGAPYGWERLGRYKDIQHIADSLYLTKINPSATGLFTIAPTGANYNEGIRILPSSNGYASIQFGANSSGAGYTYGQWGLASSPLAGQNRVFKIIYNGNTKVTIDTTGKIIASDTVRAPVFIQNGNRVATLNEVYIKAKVDSIVASIAPIMYVDSVTTNTGNTITETILIGKNLLSVSRNGIVYKITGTTTVLGNKVNVNSSGVVKFQDNINSGEYFHFLYTINPPSLVGIPNDIQLSKVNSYSDMSILLTGTRLFFIKADEVNTDDYGNLNQPAFYTYINGTLNKMSGRKAN